MFGATGHTVMKKKTSSFACGILRLEIVGQQSNADEIKISDLMCGNLLLLCVLFALIPNRFH